MNSCYSNYSTELLKIIKNSFVSFLLTVVLEIYEHDICTEIDENKSLQEIIQILSEQYPEGSRGATTLDRIAA